MSETPGLEPVPSAAGDASPDRLTPLADALVARLVRERSARAENLGAVWMACARAVADAPEDWAEALRAGRELEFLEPFAREALSDDAPQRFRGGWAGTYVGPDGRPVEDDDPFGPADVDPENAASPSEQSALSHRALRRAFALARAQGNETLLRNLGWLEQRLAHRSYDAIAREEERVPATIRTGVARARKFLLRVVHELRTAQPAPLSGDAPEAVEPLRQLWLDQDLDALAHGLERTREAHGDDPHWLNLRALLCADRGRHDEARAHYERALVQADAPCVRARVLNNLGNLLDDREDPEAARVCWLRAHQLLPTAPAPLLNLLVGASRARDYASAQHYVSQLAELHSSERFDANDRSYLLRRLRDHPDLDWLRETDAWRQGPARWIRAARRGQRLRTASAALLLLVSLCLPAASFAAPTSAGPEPGERLVRDSAHVAPAIPVFAEARPMFAKAKRGGDSMGKPPRLVPVNLPARPAGALLAGDSMGRGDGPRKRDPRG